MMNSPSTDAEPMTLTEILAAQNTIAARTNEQLHDVALAVNAMNARLDGHSRWLRDVSIVVGILAVAAVARWFL